MDLKLKGKTALVAASSRGFGKAVALGLAAEGVRVAMCSRTESDLNQAVEEVRAAGQEIYGGAVGEVLGRALDVTDGAALEDFVGEIERRFGSIDLLLVNAGGPPAGNFSELNLDQWEAAYRLTLESAVRMCQLVMPGMMARGWGRIVQITSVSVRQPVDNLLLSSVMRPAAHALVRNLALEAAPCGVTVNSVAPGYHTTSAVERLITKRIELTGCTRDDVLAGWSAEIPLGRLGKPEELAALVLFLMSANAGYITGQCIVADGGWVKGTF
jgi:3-oxoacyl-[acyl-carrier protein] reductase